MIKKQKLFDLNFISCNDIDAVTKYVYEFDREKIGNAFPVLFTPNVDYLVKIARSENFEIKSFLQKSFYIIPDGMPVVWVSKLLRKPLLSRINGATLFNKIWIKCKQHNRNCFFICANDIIGGMITNELASSKYLCPPMFDVSDVEVLSKIVDESFIIIKQFNIDFVFIGITFPKQDLLAKLLYEKCLEEKMRTPLFLLLGSSFELYLSLKPKASLFVQNIGFEWLHRFILEPKRLFKRYFIDSFEFLPLVYKEFFK